MTLTAVDDVVLCMAWVDNNTAQLMTTAYGISDIETLRFLHPKKRHGIPKNSVQYVPPPYLPSIAAHFILLDQSDRSGFIIAITYPKTQLVYGGFRGKCA